MADHRAHVVAGNTTFACDLYQRLRHQGGNLFFSPYSISTALAMTYAGARGRTATQMAQTLHFTLEQEQLHAGFAALAEAIDAAQTSGNIQLKVANALWPQAGYSLLESFLALCREYYGVEITAMDFSIPDVACKRINGWVEKATEECIKDLLSEEMLDPLTRLILTNAIYFKGDWAYQFDDRYTLDLPFHLSATKSSVTPLMMQMGRFGYAQFAQFQMLNLPYLGGTLSMLILLPREVDGLAALEDHLTAERLAEWMGGLRYSDVRVLLPKFRLISEFQLKIVLNPMGMIDAFAAADFSGMTGKRDLFISEVLHKAFVEVNEEGTEAAAATAVKMKRGGPPRIPTFRADHPFIFLIRDNPSGAILFLGRFSEPENGG